MHQNEQYYTFKGFILVSGIPASGKSSFASKLKNKLNSHSIQSKIFSTDNLEAYITLNPKVSQCQIIKLFSNSNWDQFLEKNCLDKQKFNEKSWNLSRKMIQSHELLDLLLESCQILIIEDELVLRSQRKPFRRYCFEKKLKYLQVQLEVSLEQAFKNNENRGKQDEKAKVGQEVIRKSFQKYEHNLEAIVLNKKTIDEFLNGLDIESKMKYVEIQDNYSEYLSKKNSPHQLTQKELDENQLRKLISKIMKDQVESAKYFNVNVPSKEKAMILAECKKIYTQNKRKKPFEQILAQFMLKKE